METQVSESSQACLWWGHTMADYVAMFDLTQADLDSKLLDFGAGPASFNAEMAARGKRVISCDPLYAHDPAKLRQELTDVFQASLRKIAQFPEQFIWEHIPTIESLVTKRQTAINDFLDDFQRGLDEKRYLATTPPTLPFTDQQFDLVLCSHYLFTQRLTDGLHASLDLIHAFCRVAPECRIFPLLDSHGEISPWVGPLMLALQQENLGVEIKQVGYQFQHNGNAMLRIWSQACQLT